MFWKESWISFCGQIGWNDHGSAPIRIPNGDVPNRRVKKNNWTKQHSNTLLTCRDPKYFWSTPKSLNNWTTNMPRFQWQGIFYPCNNKKKELIKMVLRENRRIELKQDKDFYNLGTEGGPSFQVANQVKSWSPRLLQYKDGIVLEGRVQQPLPCQQPYQLLHLVCETKYTWLQRTVKYLEILATVLEHSRFA